MNVTEFFKKFGIGAVIGAAMIIPGVSGGTIAVLLNIYDKLIGAISDLKKDFKNSFLFLLPIILGALVAIGAIFWPLTKLLEIAPFPTIMLFAGLLLGGIPKLFKDGIKNGFSKRNIISVLIPFAAVIAICFIPSLGEANLGEDMSAAGYICLALIGALASCALVIPGVSGSMLLLIFGYYDPILATIKSLLSSTGHSVLVLAVFAAGLVIGFFSIAKLMKFLLEKLPRGTYWAIIGFVIGSVPAILITYNGNFPDFPYSSLSIPHIVIGVVLAVAGAIASFALTALVEAKMKKKTADSSDTSSENAQNG